MAMGYLAGKLTRGAMPLSSINTMLVVYALPFALFLYTAKMQRSSLHSHLVLILLLVTVMLVPYFASLALSHFLFKAAPPNAAVRAVTIGMPNFAAVGLPLLHSVYGEASDLAVALAITTASVVMSPAGLILLERAKTRDNDGPHSNLLAKALITTFVKPIVIAPLLGVLVSLAGWQLLLAPTIDASSVHRGASKFSNVASVAILFVETGEFDSAISPGAPHRSWGLFQIPMPGPFPAGHGALCSIQLPDRAIPSSTVGPTRRHR
ncbi:AEC family transporter [Paraburkholderia madseniana]|uniref:AEC family transporter n=2 Tax=Paraburkholderia madseniana TaxID=2599607 RepID=UPI00398B34B7